MDRIVLAVMLPQVQHDMVAHVQGRAGRRLCQQGVATCHIAYAPQHNSPARNRLLLVGVARRPDTEHIIDVHDKGRTVTAFVQAAPAIMLAQHLERLPQNISPGIRQITDGYVGFAVNPGFLPNYAPLSVATGNFNLIPFFFHAEKRQFRPHAGPPFGYRFAHHSIARRHLRAGNHHERQRTTCLPSLAVCGQRHIVASQPAAVVN